MCEFRSCGICKELPAQARRSPGSLGLLLGLVLLLLCCSMPCALAQTPTPVVVPTWRYDLTHAGQNTNETALTPANVNPSTFGKLFSMPVDGSVYAQPLYVNGLTMSDGQVHNVVFVATEHDSIYAFDADSNGGANANPIWKITLLDAAHGAAAGATTVPYLDTASPDIAPEIGITATPVINPATNTMYVVGKTKESGAYFQRLHAINILTGAELPGSPVTITGTVPGTGNGSSGGQLSFSPLWQNNRTALGYYNGYIYLAFGAHGDNGPWHGWLFAYNATTLAQTAVVCLSANGFGDGVWQSGSGMPIDPNVGGGRMFLVTGNGSYSSYTPFTASSQFGDSVVAFDLTGGNLTPVDAFTPFNQAKLSSADLDQGSGGILMMPDQQGSNPHILLQAGKEGRLLVLNRDSLGGYATGVTSNTNALQDILNQSGGLWSTPAYWNGNVYIWAKGDVPKMFKVNSGVMDTTPDSKSTVSSAYPGASFMISSDGTQNAIAWAVRTDQYTTHGPQVLYAWDANDLTNLLYESDTNIARDGGGKSMKFAIPVVTNGKVYIAANGELDVYGLFNNAPIAAAPVFSPNGGSFGGTLNVTVTSASASADIYYTLDGTTPTPASTLYTGPIAITKSVTINAIATGNGYIQSPVSSASFTSLGQTPPVTFMPGAGTYATAKSVTLADTDANAAIYYTTDGSTPSASSTPYTAPIAVTASTTIQAIAIDPTLQSSNVTTASYVIQPGGSSIDFGNGFASVAGLTLNGSAVNTDDSRLQLTTGATYQAGSFFWNQPIGIQSFTTDFSFQLSNAQADGFTFTIQNIGPTALGASGSGLGYQNITKSVAIKFDLYSNAGEGTDSTGVYTNGAIPTVPAVDMTSSGVILRSGDAMLAHVTYDGTTLTMNLLDMVTNKTFVLSQAINIPQVVGGNTAYVGFTGSTGGLSASQKILYWTYATQAPGTTTAAPVFSPAGGNFTTAPSVTLTDSTTGAVIYYTTNGTAPTTSSFVYTSPIVVGMGTTTIQAMAVASGMTQSATVTATYVVSQPVTATPTFSPAAGTYNAAQNVTLNDASAGAVIYYTTDGTTPTTSSTVYSMPIAVSTSTTINAMAVAPSMQASAGATASYVISQPVTATPTFSPAAGTYGSAQNVMLNDTTAGAVIYYTTDGTTPTTSSAVYSAAIAVTSSTTIKAMAVAPGMQASAVATAAYTIVPGGLAIDFSGGFPSANGLALNGNALITNNKLQLTTTSGTYQDASAFWNQPVGVQSFTTDFSFQQLSAQGDGFTFTIQNAGPNALGASGSGLGYQKIAKSVAIKFDLYSNAGEGTDSTGVYTNGAIPTVPAVDMTSSGVILRSGDAMRAHVTYDGTTLTMNLLDTTTNKTFVLSQAINIPQIVGGNTAYVGFTGSTGGLSAIQSLLNWTYAAQAPTPVTAAPVFSPQPGNYTASQNVTLSSATSGAVIYYTTDGTAPTTSSSVYANPIAVGMGTTTIQAMAVASGMTQSATVTATYVVSQPVTASPTFSPAAGTYNAAQNVTLNDASAGAVIYYTTDGTTPTTSSTVYSTPIAVSTSTTINAMAVAPSMQASAVATANYVIQTGTTPTVNFPNGFSSATGLSLKGSALVSNNVLQLTAAPNTYVKGAAWYATPVNISSFTTDFDFQLLSARADGFTFAIQSAGLSSLGPAGSGLGYGASHPGGTGGIGHSVAVKFDLYNNDGEGANSTGVYVNGASPTVPATDLTASGVKLNSGHVLHAHITYDGTNLTLTLTDTVTSATFTNAFPVNIPTALGSSNGYVGFTGATGGLSMTANILDWTLTGGGVSTATIAPAIERPALPGAARPRPGVRSGVAEAAPAHLDGAAQMASAQATADTVGARQAQPTAAAAGMQGEALVSPVNPQIFPVTVQTTTAAEPAFFPKPGVFDGDTQVTLRSETPGAVIHYTFDGSQPLANSPVYTGPIQVKGTALTIKAFATAPGKKDSAVVTGTYRIRE